MKKRVLALIMAVALSFNTVVFAEETEPKIIIGTENETVNNLLEMSHINYIVQLYAESTLYFCDTIEMLLYNPAATKQEQQQKIDSIYTQVVELEQYMTNYQSSIDSLLQKYPCLDGDIQASKDSIETLLLTCRTFKNILSTLSEYNKNDSVELYNECLDTILEIHDLMIDYYSSRKDIFWLYFDEALDLSRQ